ncbi:hypothetical protein [Vulgatibacter sp.]|uniref:hypothetical protein n=1 Tax=Vulgatibacter sp. TaxID=1971226 RepID=UPI003566BCED
MEWLVRLLVPVALAHPGHVEPAWCDPGPALSCPLPTAETSGRSEIHLARMLVERGLAAQAAVRVAEEAKHDAEAAAILAQALEALGDAKGAELAAARAATLRAAK